MVVLTRSGCTEVEERFRSLNFLTDGVRVPVPHGGVAAGSLGKGFPPIGIRDDCLR
jgi:hypothetical protein